jgi:hypothetical protein
MAEKRSIGYRPYCKPQFAILRIKLELLGKHA